MIYRFIHGTSPNHIVDHLKVGYSTTRKYIEIVCNIFTNEPKLFNQCINISIGAQLEKGIISNFRVLTQLPNVVNAIDGTHIHLPNHLNHKMTLAMCDFFNRKKMFDYFAKVCDVNNIFWNICVNQFARGARWWPIQNVQLIPIRI
jgi:hypothetical protein